ncbi:hypothetical protein L2E82_22604 [Cichorium intybus]|uniref:Uncharacterized protein n=1 Tax=Cichorium intybus TaxID=13427 RepID=A0ACB9DYF1_CICIN|nr:hypothetical protein L2E82_22604 [Cichorium intybus]
MRLSRLSQLDLSYNLFYQMLPYWIGNFSLKLEKLDMGFNSFRGEIPEGLLHLKSLKYLGLSHNNFSGNLPDFRQALEHLSLDSNSFSGDNSTSCSSNKLNRPPQASLAAYGQPGHVGGQVTKQKKHWMQIPGVVHAPLSTFLLNQSQLKRMTNAQFSIHRHCPVYG